MVNVPLFRRQSCIFYTDFSEHHQRVALFSCCMPLLQTPAAAYCLIFAAHKLGLGISFCASDWFLVFFPFYPTSLLVKQEPAGNVFSCVCVAQVWDLRQNKLIYNMHGHGDSVTGLSLSSEGSYLLSNSMDNTGY